VQDLYLDRQPREAAAAVPQEFIDRTSLLGPADRIADRMRDYAASGVTTLSVTLLAGDRDSSLRTLRTVADAFAASGVAS
jgi:alkanesulfonate monooxygenase SsuD/methylene tetrahydromethanopterin reductase-like flavin-dependent oxidoreductase (luciferase family)